MQSINDLGYSARNSQVKKRSNDELMIWLIPPPPRSVISVPIFHFPLREKTRARSNCQVNNHRVLISECQWWIWYQGYSLSYQHCNGQWRWREWTSPPPPPLLLPLLFPFCVIAIRHGELFTGYSLITTYSPYCMCVRILLSSSPDSGESRSSRSRGQRVVRYVVPSTPSPIALIATAEIQKETIFIFLIVHQSAPVWSATERKWDHLLLQLRNSFFVHRFVGEHCEANRIVKVAGVWNCGMKMLIGFHQCLISTCRPWVCVSQVHPIQVTRS